MSGKQRTLNWRIATALGVFTLMLLAPAAWVAAQGCRYDSYHPPLWHHPSELARCEYFADRLARDFDFSKPGEVVWLYSNGYSPLDSELVRTALEKSTAKAETLVLATAQLKKLVAGWSAGEIDSPGFRLQAGELASQIQDLADDIEEDYYVGFLDPRQTESPKVPAVSPLDPVGRLSKLVEFTSLRAQAIQSDLRRFVEEDQSQVVSVSNLRNPSLKSLAKSVETLAGRIKDLLKELPAFPGQNLAQAD